MFITLAKTLAGLKVGFVSKYAHIKILYSLKSLNVLYNLYKLGYIRGYTILSKKKVKVYIKYIRNTGVLRNIYLISRASRKFYIKYRSLKGSLINNFVSLNGFMLISSSRGKVLTDVEATIIKQGGSPLLFVS